jgi:hypothetical protein
LVEVDRDVGAEVEEVLVGGPDGEVEAGGDGAEEEVVVVALDAGAAAAIVVLGGQVVVTGVGRNDGDSGEARVDLGVVFRGGEA